jgi:hypothetical protein
LRPLLCTRCDNVSSVKKTGPDQAVFTPKADLARKLMRYIRDYNRTAMPNQMAILRSFDPHRPYSHFNCYGTLGA